MNDIMNLPDTEVNRKELRNFGTPAEATLWKLLKDKQVEGLKFRRQHSVGCYILDFYCPALHLGIELDGEVHADAQAKDYDERRTRYLMNEKGIIILRFENRTVFENPSQIVEEIKEVMKKRDIFLKGVGVPTTSPLSGYSSFLKEESGDTLPLVQGDTLPLVQGDTQPFIQRDVQPLINGDTLSLISEDTPPFIREDAKSLINEDTQPIATLTINYKL